MEGIGRVGALCRICGKRMSRQPQLSRVKMRPNGRV